MGQSSSSKFWPVSQSSSPSSKNWCDGLFSRWICFLISESLPSSCEGCLARGCLRLPSLTCPIGLVLRRLSIVERAGEPRDSVGEVVVFGLLCVCAPVVASREPSLVLLLITSRLRWPRGEQVEGEGLAMLRRLASFNMSSR